jgi:hypothetical protein
VPGEYLDGWLGHWNYGQSPQDTLSTLPCSEVLDELRHHVESLMSANGWEVEYGL